MTRYKYFTLSPGHGGLAFSRYYMTDGKQSPDGTFLEGVYNRQVADQITRTYPVEVDFCNLVPGPTQMPLDQRCYNVNRIINKHNHIDGSIAHMALHCNAMGRGEEWHSASGFVVFYPRQSTHKKTSKKFAEIIVQKLGDSDYPLAPRGSGIKQAGFRELVEVNCPSVLIEMGFMTNKHDLQLLRQYQSTISQAIVDACIEFSCIDFD